MIRFASTCLLGLFALPAIAEPPAPVGARVAEFARTDVLTGKPWALAEQTREAKVTVIAFTSTGCPASLAYAPRLVDMQKRYAKQGVQFVAINSHLDEDAASVAKQATALGLNFPVLKDDGTTLADKLSIDRVPCVLLLDATKTVRYKGRIDDQFAPGVHRSKATTRELGNALDALLEGREIAAPFVAAAGCKLTRTKVAVANENITYHKQVSRIFQAKCQECHREGEAGPFALTSYKTAANWSDMIREVVADDIMPPWHADAPRGHFKNDRRLSDDEKKTLLAWVDAGCPEGDAKDAPPPIKTVQGWRLSRKPDIVLTMEKPVQVPAASLLGMGVPYQYIWAGEAFKEDTWVTGIEVRADYRAVVHHIIAFVIPPGAEVYDIAGPEFGRHMLGAYVPGDQPIELPEGYARKLEKGSRIIFELHYTPNGKPGNDASMIGLVTTKTPPKVEVGNVSIANYKFQLPANSTQEVKSKQMFPKATTLVSLTPHMHYRGKAFKYELVEFGKDGKENRSLLLNVPKYDFNWQVSYDFAKPPTVPAGAWIECTATFDNTTANPFNPDPAKRVRWGNQTWEEMMIGFAMYHTTK